MGSGGLWAIFLSRVGSNARALVRSRAHSLEHVCLSFRRHTRDTEQLSRKNARERQWARAVRWCFLSGPGSAPGCLTHSRKACPGLRACGALGKTRPRGSVFGGLAQESCARAARLPPTIGARPSAVSLCVWARGDKVTGSLGNRVSTLNVL